MLFCDQPSFEKWSPDFSTSGLSNPIWTRVRCVQAELCNSLEWTEWSTNPVQVEICEACGTVGCASGGYVNVSSLRDVVLWTRPYPVKTETQFFPATAIERFGSVAIPLSVCERFRSAATEVPEPESLTRTDGSTLCSAWASGQTRPKAVDQLVPWLCARLLAADTLDKSAAIKWVEHWLNWFRERATVGVDGVISTVENSSATIEKLYFDGPSADDWPAFAQYRNSFVPALGANHVFLPGQ